MKGKGITLSDDELDVRRMSEERPHTTDSSDSPVPSRSRSAQSAVPETVPAPTPPILRRTARMRTGPYCPMPSGLPAYFDEASSSRRPAQYTLFPSAPTSRPPTVTERYTPHLSGRAYQAGERPYTMRPETPPRRGLSEGEIQGLSRMATDLAGAMQQLIEHDSRIRENYVDLRHTELVAIRAIRTARRYMWACYVLIFLLAVAVVRLV